MKRTIEITANKLTENGAFQYPYFSQESGIATFNTNMNTCYFNDRTFKKIKGGGSKGGNYLCIEEGEEYRIST